MTSKSPSFQAITTLQNPILTELNRHVKHQQQLLHQVQAALPKALAEHLVHCLITQNHLILYTHSANWASQLRFYSKVIIEAVTIDTQSKTNIRLQTRVITNPVMTHSKKCTVSFPSIENIEFIRSYANATQSDNPLKIALLKLANTLTRASSR